MPHSDFIPAAENLVPGVSAGPWRQWAPQPHLSPLFSREECDGQAALCISMDGRPGLYGCWICAAVPATGGKTYWFSVEYRLDGEERENTCAGAILTWRNGKGKSLARDYAEAQPSEREPWHILAKRMEAPAGTVTVDVELMFRWSRHGRAWWSSPVLAETQPLAHRRVRVATTAMGHFGTVEENLREAATLARAAAERGTDIVCLRECILNFWTNTPPQACAQAIPGELTDVFGAIAKEYGTYLIYNNYEKDDGLVYNTSLLIDRQGSIAGRYRKTHLPLAEAEMGVTPGHEFPVFQTDFGSIGMLTCYDHYFPEPARILKLKGAEMLFVPTIGYTPRQVVSRAADNGLYAVIACRASEPGRASCIYDPTGRMISHVIYGQGQFAVADIDLDRRFLQRWLSIGQGEGDCTNLFAKERRPELYGELTSQEGR